MIVCLTGPARSGKDTAAAMLESEGFHKRALADKLRDFLEAQNPWVKMDNEVKFAELRWIIKRYGWDGYKTSPFAANVRRLIQVTGTEAGRGVVGESIWINALVNDMPKGHVVISDVRFDNEAETFRRYGNAVVLRLERPGIELLTGHTSEDGVSEGLIDANVMNNGTLDDLRNNLFSALSALRK